MKKSLVIASLAVFIVIASPSFVEAAWWNPFSWFKKSDSSLTIQNTSSPSVKTATPQNIEKTKTAEKPKSNLIMAKLGDKLSVFGITGSVIEVTEDSRCPAQVNCIQAGTVKIKVRARQNFLSKTITLTLNQPFTFRGYSVTLVDVQPQKTQKAIAPSDYVFGFSFATPKKETTSKTSNELSPASVASCLKEKKAVFYGAFWCPHCQAQKALFGNAAADLPYVECSTSDGTGQTAICQEKGIQSYPTWKFADGTELGGEVSIADLAQKAQCVGAKPKPIEEPPIISITDLRVQSEVFKMNRGGTYAGFCASDEARSVLDQVFAETGNRGVCHDTATAWAASSMLEIGSYVCTDSAGFINMEKKSGLADGALDCQ